MLNLSMYNGFRKTLSNNSICVLKTAIRKNVNVTANQAENTVYPPILDLSLRGRIKRKRDDWHNKIKKLETVEEKLYGINMPHYYGWKSLHLEEGTVTYNSLDHAQYITRTHVINDSKLPEFYDTVITNERLDSMVQTIKDHVENIITFEYCNRLREHEITEELEEDRKIAIQNAVTNAIVHQINRILLATLSPTAPYLLESQVDFEPRIEAFWFAGGIERPPKAQKCMEKIERLKEIANDPINIPVQYLGTPILQLRHQFPLREIASSIESSNPELHVPEFKFDPRVLGYRFSHRYASCIPGFWPGDLTEFGLLSYHNLNKIHFGPIGLDKDAITVQAIYASYSWLLSQACYQGFSTFNDITYPLVSQTILTTGQLWSFCVYQLNTTLVHSEHSVANPKRNICWITEPMKLFDKVEEGKVHGLNEDVLKKLIVFYMNMPAERTDVNMKPYLGETTKYIADIVDSDRRTWLENHFKHLMSNRPRHFKIPQVYNWQKIYMIDNDTRPLDKKRDPWQFGYRPSKRRLNDHLPIYIPKCLRENPKKRKVGRWAKTYYPDA